MKCFLEVVVHWRMIRLLFTYAVWPLNAKKKTFPLHFFKVFLFRIAWKNTSCECKNVFAINGSFCEIDAFSLGVFLICAIWRVMETRLETTCFCEPSMKQIYFLNSSPDVWLDANVFLSSTDSYFDPRAWFLLWYSLSALLRCVCLSKSYPFNWICHRLPSLKV